MTVTRSTNGPACLALPAFVPWRDQMSRVPRRVVTATNVALIALFIVAAFIGSALFAWGITRPLHQELKHTKKACTCMEDE